MCIELELRLPGNTPLTLLNVLRLFNVLTTTASLWPIIQYFLLNQRLKIETNSSKRQQQLACMMPYVPEIELEGELAHPALLSACLPLTSRTACAAVVLPAAMAACVCRSHSLRLTESNPNGRLLESVIMLAGVIPPGVEWRSESIGSYVVKVVQ